jgi:hypothetical protein
VPSAGLVQPKAERCEVQRDRDQQHHPLSNIGFRDAFSFEAPVFDIPKYTQIRVVGSGFALVAPLLGVPMLLDQVTDAQSAGGKEIIESVSLWITGR